MTMTLRERSYCYVIRGLKPVAQLLKTWFLNVAYDYINSHKLTQAEEDILEKVSDFYLEAIRKLENEN